MSIVDLSIKRPVTVLMGSLALVLFGIIAYTTLPVSLLPETAVPVVSVQTVYPGASPLVIETQLTKKIEDQLFSIGELDSVTSYSMDSVSIVAASFKDGKDENLALQEVKDKIDAIIADLPSGVQKPVVSKMDITSGTPVMNIIFEGAMSDTELYAYASTVVRDRLSQVAGVGTIEVSGGQKREISVELHRSAVFERFLPVEQIGAILARANMEIPGGNIGIDDQDVPVRFRGELSSLEEIENLDVPTRAGVFKLRQLADIRDGHEQVRERTIFLDKIADTRSENVRNEHALLLRVMKNPSANTVSVVDGIMKVIPRLEKEMGGTIKLKVIREDAGFIRDSVNDTLSNLVMGIILTGLVLFVFLHDWRSTLIISLSMPFSLISTFLVMKTMGISINVLSLMGLSCAVGTLVANSVVVLENIFRHKEQGLSRAESAAVGTREVLMAVIASTMTNVVVFVPLGSMQGAMGQILSHFAYTVVISTVFSIVVSFTVTPLLASRLLPEKTKQDGVISKKLEAFFKWLEKCYGTSISFLIKRKRRSGFFVLVVFAVFILSMAAFSGIKMELVPKSDGGRIQVDVELPQGSGLEKTALLLAEIENRLAQYQEVQTILTNLGAAGSMEKDVSVARMELSLVAKTKRRLSNSDLAAAMVRTLSDIPGADIRVVAPSEMVIAQGAPVDLYLRGADSAILQELGNILRKKMQAIPGIMNTAINTKAGKRELVFVPNRKQISQDGLTVQGVAVSLRAALDGMVSTTFREKGEEYDIRVKMGDSGLHDIEDLRNIPILTGAGIFPLSRYADVHFENGYNMIMRFNKSRTVEITAELLPDYTQGAVLSEVMHAAEELDLPEGYTISQAGLSDAMGEGMISMAIVFLTAILLVYMLLAAVLESLSQPLFILSTVPLSLIGVAAGCLITNTVLNNIAMIGIVMLVGIVVNNAILLLDYYNQLKIQGLTVQEALIKACPAKLKPILMSNIAIILGMIPMALGIGASLAEMRQPMGVIVIGGIISSTIMTLWLIPCLEFVVSRKRRRA
ncbi:acriflavin resistance protein [Spirochaetia bacterium]|nr:acriflavin resistance protein [Spirochaetia bacterium]